MKRYYRRIIDDQISEALDAMGAVLIEGPKWCGKTTTATQHAKSVLRMQSPSAMVENRLIAETKPSLLLEGEKPRLIDEWQTEPVIWDAVRIDVDLTGEVGQYILTGSSSPLPGSTMHTGIGRIARLKMSTMSLFESLDSSGEVSLIALFRQEGFTPSQSKVSLDDIANLICRGGWPQSVGVPMNQSLFRMRQYVQSIYNGDINEAMESKMDPARVERFLKSYVRHTQTMTKNSVLLEDMKANDIAISDTTFYNYQEKLQRMFILEETPAWSPNIRSKTAIRTSNKKGFTDPSIPAAILGMDPSALFKDFRTFGFLFESLCIRDLRIYAQALNGKVFHYRDAYGLECDAVLRLPSDEFALIEIKLGAGQEDEAAKNLIKLESLLESTGKKPSFKMIVTGSTYAYQRSDGVYVVPLACLKD